MGKMQQKGRRQRTKALNRQDRITWLPDCLIIEILSRLVDTKEAIKTGVLSKRWQHLWTLVPTLNFYTDNNYSLSKFYSSLNQTLNQYQRHYQLKKLKIFRLNSEFQVRYQAHVNRWIRYAISCNVEEMYLTLRPTKKVALYSKTKTKFQLKDKSIFINSCFTHLKLESCVFNPTGPISWAKLKSLHICKVELDEDLIQKILSGSPLLETLMLECCYGFKRLDITSKSVKNLEVFEYSINDVNSDDEMLHYQFWEYIIEINAPYILSLNIQGYLDAVKLLFLDMSSLVKATLDYRIKWYHDLTQPEETLKGFIVSFSHVKVLQLGDESWQVLSWLKAEEGFIVPSNVKCLDGYL